MLKSSPAHISVSSFKLFPPGDMICTFGQRKFFKKWSEIEDSISSFQSQRFRRLAQGGNQPMSSTRNNAFNLNDDIQHHINLPVATKNNQNYNAGD